MSNLQNSNYTKFIIEFILKKAHQLKEDAGYVGRMDDGGAGRLEDQVKFYQYGVTGEFPSEWIYYRKEFEKENDPQYKTYLELKKKFETK